MSTKACKLKDNTNNLIRLYLNLRITLFKLQIQIFLFYIFKLALKSESFTDKMSTICCVQFKMNMSECCTLYSVLSHFKIVQHKMSTIFVRAVHSITVLSSIK